MKNVIAADPFIFFDENSGNYYIYATGMSKDEKKSFVIYKSKDLVEWEFVRYALNVNKVPFGKDWFWAPEVTYSPYNGYYFMFYSCRIKDELNEKYFGEKEFEENCKICVAYSKSPEGPFKSFKEPLDFSPYDPSYVNVDKIVRNNPNVTIDESKLEKGSSVPLIDADILIDENKKIYMYCSRICYKSFRYDKEYKRYIEASEIIGVELENSWYYSKRLIKPRVKKSYKNFYGPNKDYYEDLISYRTEHQEWENHHIDDFALKRNEGKNRRWSEGSYTFYKYINGKKKYFTYYSCNCYLDRYYAVGAAYSDKPLGKYKKDKKNPIISAEKFNNEICSIGHGAFLIKGDKYIYSFHARESLDKDRQLFFAEVNPLTLEVKLLPKPYLK